MKVLTTGVDERGRSAVLTSRELSLVEVAPGLSAYRVVALGPDLPARPPGRADHVDLGVPPGGASAVLWRYEPDTEVRMHHTDTVDALLIIDGAVELLLDDGSHPLGPGDWVVMKGVDHGWRAGPHGCLASAFAVGTPAPEARA